MERNSFTFSRLMLSSQLLGWPPIRQLPSPWAMTLRMMTLRIEPPGNRSTGAVLGVPPQRRDLEMDGVALAPPEPVEAMAVDHEIGQTTLST